MEFLKFVSGLAVELFELYEYSKKNQPDPEQEKQIAGRLIRKASDEQFRREMGL